MIPVSQGSRLYLIQLALIAVGLLLMIFGWWRQGVIVFGASFIASAVLRIVVPDRQTGMLRVRGKVFDVFWTALLGSALIVLAISIPLQPV